MLAELKTKIFHRRRMDRGDLLFSNSDWLNRYAHPNIWRQKSLSVRNQLEDLQLKNQLLEEVSPLEQYRTLELLARFGNDDLEAIKSKYDDKTIDFVGDLFGDILLYYQQPSGVQRRTSFLENRIFLDISQTSIAIGIEKLFDNLNKGAQNLNPEMEPYLVSLLYSLGTISHLNHNKIPPSLFEELNRIIELRQKRISV